MIFESDCNDGWERIDCDFDKSSDLSDLDVAELLTIIDSFLDSMIGSIFFQWNSLEMKYVKLNSYLYSSVQIIEMNPFVIKNTLNCRLRVFLPLLLDL